jgi:predicted MFS family arabinose efflux permease
MSRPVSERALVFLLGSIQFINILDFMMVMPLGPDFASELGIPLARLGIIGGSYTFAAAIAGVAGSFFLERFDRRTAILTALAGLTIATAAGGLATGLYSLVAARAVAGLFGGPATSLAFSILADVIPAERRGRAVGSMMGAFSVASVIGVPFALESARVLGWRSPFWIIAGLGLLVGVFAGRLLPSLRDHIEAAAGPGNPAGDTIRRFNGSAGARIGSLELLRRPTVVASYAMTASVMMAGFLVIPNISAFLQQNLAYPRSGLGTLYMLGGAVSFVALRIGGKLVDRYGSFRVSIGSALAVISCLEFGFAHPAPWLPAPALFVAFMLSMSFRNVSYNTLTSKVPGPRERARFLSFQSAVQHLASSSGAFLSTVLLGSTSSGRLLHMENVAYISIGLTLCVPVITGWVEARVRAAAAVAGEGTDATAEPEALVAS